MLNHTKKEHYSGGSSVLFLLGILESHGIAVSVRLQAFPIFLGLQEFGILRTIPINKISTHALVQKLFQVPVRVRGVYSDQDILYRLSYLIDLSALFEYITVLYECVDSLKNCVSIDKIVKQQCECFKRQVFCHKVHVFNIFKFYRGIRLLHTFHVSHDIPYYPPFFLGRL